MGSDLVHQIYFPIFVVLLSSIKNTPQGFWKQHLSRASTFTSLERPWWESELKCRDAGTGSRRAFYTLRDRLSVLTPHCLIITSNVQWAIWPLLWTKIVNLKCWCLFYLYFLRFVTYDWPVASRVYVYWALNNCIRRIGYWIDYIGFLQKFSLRWQARLQYACHDDSDIISWLYHQQPVAVLGSLPSERPHHALPNARPSVGTTAWEP